MVGQTQLSSRTLRANSDKPRAAICPLAQKGLHAAPTAFCTDMAVLPFAEIARPEIDIRRPAMQPTSMSR